MDDDDSDDGDYDDNNNLFMCKTTGVRRVLLCPGISA